MARQRQQNIYWDALLEPLSTAAAAMVELGIAAPKVGQLIKADGTVTEIVPEKGKKFTLQELQKLVGGYVERLQLPGRAVMIANEEGYPMGLPHNAKASEIAGRDIVGDVVVLPRGMGW